MTKVTIIYTNSLHTVWSKYALKIGICLCWSNVCSCRYYVGAILHVELFQIFLKTDPENDVLVHTFSLKSEINLRWIRGPQIFLSLKEFLESQVINEPFNAKAWVKIKCFVFLSQDFLYFNWSLKKLWTFKRSSFHTR
jgi:hypothetical protein